MRLLITLLVSFGLMFGAYAVEYPNARSRKTFSVMSEYQVRIAYDGSDNPEYVGVGSRGIASSDDGWLILKITYTGSNATLIQHAYGIWVNRASLSFK